IRSSAATIRTRTRTRTQAKPPPTPPTTTTRASKSSKPKSPSSTTRSPSSTRKSPTSTTTRSRTSAADLLHHRERDAVLAHERQIAERDRSADQLGMLAQRLALLALRQVDVPRRAQPADVDAAVGEHAGGEVDA